MDSAMTPFFLHLFLLVFLFLSSSKPHLCSSAAATDTLFSGQSLSANQTLVSKGGTFELGFFSPGKSRNYYLGMWYKENSPVASRTIVWVANRDIPITDPSSSQFKLLENGNLVLFDNTTSDKIPIWSTNSTSKTSNSSKSVLGDDGNLVLNDGSDPSNVLWQSFDYITDTQLPGSKTGYNHITNQGIALTSWKNSENPAKGIFSFVVQADGSGSLLWNGTHEYYSVGLWNGNGFTNIPELTRTKVINYTYVSNENESYFIYSPYNKALLLRVTVEKFGQLKSFARLQGDQEWNLFFCKPLLKCDVYGLCGNFGVCTANGSPVCQCLPGFREKSLRDWKLLDFSGGCARKTPLQCGGRDRFLKMTTNIKLPASTKSFSNFRGAEECKSTCLDNCSCSAYAYNTTYCLVWYESMLNTQQLSTGGDDLFIRVAASEVLNSSGTKKISTIWFAVGSVSGIIILIVAIVVVLLIVAKGRKNKNISDESTLGPTFTQYAFLTAFKYKDLKVATKNFTEKLGGGSFGTVFKGALLDSSFIAVKKLDGFSQGEKQFRSEVRTIGLIQHVNLVRLRGFCSKGIKRMLVYDFMPHGSLDSHLFHRNDSNVLNWKTRYQVAVGTARGLAYLHEECRDCIIHCDIKPENILLDADFTPKVADFGLAKLVGREFSRVVTTMRGTIGYLAPEWSSGMAITAKADVYSYGMMLFEIISGRRNLKRSKDGKVWYFPTWASKKLAEGRDVISLIDFKLKGNADVEEVTRALKVAAWCIQEEEAQRPTMGQVIQMLEGLLEVTPPPIPTYLQVFVENEETVNFFPEPTT